MVQEVYIIDNGEETEDQRYKRRNQRTYSTRKRK